jgi:hypothetical protein
VVRTCQRRAIAPFDYLIRALPRLSDLQVNRGKGQSADASWRSRLDWLAAAASSAVDGAAR